MIVKPLFYGALFTCNCAFLAAMIIPSFKEDGALRIFNARPNGLEFALKRSVSSLEVPDSAEADSKERRSKMGSNFVRFGRSWYDGNSDKPNFLTSNDVKREKSRQDNNIRLGRSGLMSMMPASPGKPDQSFIRYGRNSHRLLPAEVDASLLCHGILLDGDARSSELRAYLSKLAYLCNGSSGNGENGPGHEEKFGLRNDNIVFEDDNGDSI